MNGRYITTAERVGLLLLAAILALLLCILAIRKLSREGAIVPQPVVTIVEAPEVVTEPDSVARKKSRAVKRSARERQRKGAGGGSEDHQSGPTLDDVMSAE